MNQLEGKTIKGIEIDKEGQHFLRFITDQGAIGFEAQGDCCSESWFADITGVSAMIGHTVQTVEEISATTANDQRTRQEEDTVYGYKIVTDAGHALVAFRNSSNGYYGGWLEPTSDANIPADIQFMPVTDDYSA